MVVSVEYDDLNKWVVFGPHREVRLRVNFDVLMLVTESRYMGLSHSLRYDV